MPYFTKKPVTVEARQVVDDLSAQVELVQWVRDSGGDAYVPPSGSHIVVVTIEGAMRADLGWWVIRGVMGEFYPCRPDIFEETYEAAA